MVMMVRNRDEDGRMLVPLGFGGFFQGGMGAMM